MACQKLSENWFPRVNRRDYVFSGIKHPAATLNFLKLLLCCFDYQKKRWSAHPQLVQTSTAPLQLEKLHPITAAEVLAT